MKISIFGAGGWGTAIAMVLQSKRHRVTVWGHDPVKIENLRAFRENRIYLPGIPIPAEIEFTSSTEAALKDAELAVVAIPSHALRGTLNQFKAFRFPSNIPWVSLTKGLELDTGYRMTQVVKEVLGTTQVASLSGPSLAHEVASEVPAALVVAAEPDPLADRLQEIFMTSRFRVYTCRDLPGVELGGALKNVIALGAGISDGIGFGENSKAALVTRGLAEITRLGIALGAKKETFFGLSGLGDLMVTAHSRNSRNRTLGERIGRGEKLKDILAGTKTVAEGVRNAESFYRVAKKLAVDTPIINEVYAILYENKDPRTAVETLMGRDAKPE